MINPFLLTLTVCCCWMQVGDAQQGSVLCPLLQIKGRLQMGPESPKTLRPTGSVTSLPADSLRWILFTLPGAAPAQPARSYYVSRGSVAGIFQVSRQRNHSQMRNLTIKLRLIQLPVGLAARSLPSQVRFRMTGVVFFGAGSQEMRSPASSSRQMFQTRPADALDSVSALPLPSLPLRTGVFSSHTPNSC